MAEELLLELFCEEIPARMQGPACEQLSRLVSAALTQAGLAHAAPRTFATPRRIACAVAGIPERTADVREERKGPRVGAPEKAMEGFLRSTGLAVDQLTKQSDAKGEFYIAVIEKQGRASLDALAEILPKAIADLPWPKSMRWGRGTFRWVRPLKSVLCLFGSQVVPLRIDLGDKVLQAGPVTYGHRFMAPAPIEVFSFTEYRKKLDEAFVVLDPADRRALILARARELAREQDLVLVEDEALLIEVAGLVENPVVLMGRIDARFMDLPPEVLTTSMRAHQKYFALRDKATGRMAPNFIVVANLAATDGGAAIVNGNERVLRARLSDAEFFWQQDKKIPLTDRLPELEKIVFHEKLGTVGERAERLEKLAREIAPLVGADPDQAAQAARLSKADLVTGMVGEFPELQGLMGYYYAREEGLGDDVAKAIRDHYKPQGPSDSLPENAVGAAVALADKFDVLAGFWWIDEKPTGSRDPFALRRAALGIIRITLEQNCRLRFSQLACLASIVLLANSAEKFGRNGNLQKCEDAKQFNHFFKEMTSQIPKGIWLFLLEDIDEIENMRGFVNGQQDVLDRRRPMVDKWVASLNRLVGDVIDVLNFRESYLETPNFEIDQFTSLLRTSLPRFFEQIESRCGELLSFIADRLKVYLRDRGARHDLVDAVFSLPGQDDLVLIVARIEALTAFLKSDDGANLLAAHKRAANILRIEEKKDGVSYTDDPDSALLPEPAERELYEAITLMQPAAAKALEDEDFAAAMAALAQVRAPVDRFFEVVTVNADDAALRANRLKLLSLIRRAMAAIADFSKIEG